MELFKKYRICHYIPPLQPRSVFYNKLNPNNFIKAWKIHLFIKFLNEMKFLYSVRFYLLAGVKNMKINSEDLNFIFKIYIYEYKHKKNFSQ